MKFGMIFSAIILGILVIFTLAFSAIYRDVKSQAVAELNITQTVHARQAAMGITEHMENVVATLDILAHIPDIVDMNDAGMKFMDGFQQSHAHEIRGVTRLNAGGRIVYTAPFLEGAVGRDISDQEHVRTILLTHEPVISDVFMAVQGFRSMAVHVPVFRNGAFDGTIGFLLSFDTIARRHIENINIGKSGYAWVISEKGIEISCPVPGHINRSIFDTCRDFPEIIAMAREMMKRREGVTTYHYDHVRGTAVGKALKHAVYMPIPLHNTFWSIVVATPEDEILASLAGFRMKLGVITATLLVLFMAFTYLLVRSRIVIREQKKREAVMAALQKSETRYRSIFENTGNATVIFDENGVIRLANSNFERLSGYSRQEIEGIRTWMEFVAPEDLDRMAGYLRQGLDDPRSAPTRYEFRFVDRSGETKYILLTVARIRGSTEWVSSLMDITIRRRAEEALRDREEMLNALVETSQDWIWAMDLHFAHTYSNPATRTILGYEADEIVGSTLDLMHPEDMDMVRRNMPSWISEKRGWQNLLVRFRHKDGTWRYLESSSVPIFGASGELVGFRGVDRDVTERMQVEAEQKRLRDQLAHAQKIESVGQLAGGIAHDFNNMLTPIMGYAELLGGNIPHEDPRHTYVEQILRSAERSRDLVRQLLAFARRQALEMKPVDLNRTIEHFEKILRRALHENIVLQVRLTPGLGTIMADVGQIEQIILNLAVNAQDAMPDGGTLSIETGEVFLDASSVDSREGVEPGPHVMMRLTDTGTGMDDEVMSHLFEPFFTTKAPGKGTGLGLATVYGIVRQHGGHITVESRRGSGSTFTVFIPRHGASMDQESPDTRTELSVQGREYLLVVEDEDQVRDLITGVLSGYGYRVLAAADASMALERSASHPGAIDLLLTDVILPDMNGKALFERLSAERPGLRAIYMSGYTADVITKHGVLDPGIAFIQKPFSLKVLAQKVREVLDAGIS